jgi:DNA-binding HxlR family transcriptional regulator
VSSPHPRLYAVWMSDRSYDDACGLARALDAVGERWTLLIVRELLLGPKRFNDLKSGLSGPSQNVLTQRLRELEQAGLVRRTILGPPASVRVYELTDRGLQLEPSLLELSRWGARTSPRPDASESVDAFALSLRALYSGNPVRPAVTLSVDGDFIEACAREGALMMRRVGSPGSTTITGSLSDFRIAVWGERPASVAALPDSLRVDGEVDLAVSFLNSFGGDA